MHPTRYIGLDIHKHYLVAIGVDKEQNQVYGPRRVAWPEFEAWIKRDLLPTDSVVVEMTTNTWQVYDTLQPAVYNVLVVHPPQVKAIVKARVMTDKRAALILAQLHAANLLPGIWVPDLHTRELRALVAQRRNMSRLSVAAKNRLHAVIHRHHFIPPEGFELFHPNMRAWWAGLKVSPIEKVNILCDLDTLAFAQKEKSMLEEYMGKEAGEDERIPLLVQIPGMGLVTAITVLAAIGTVARFPDAQHLVGYAGLGASVHASGQSYTTGRITKAGRRDLRAAMVEVANVAVMHHPYWKAQLERMERRLGRSKAIVAIARKLLITVWHVLTQQVIDKHGDARSIATSLFATAYRIKVRNLPGGMSALRWTRHQLDRLGLGAEVKEIPWGSKVFNLPPSEIMTKR
jgi:transposase